MLWRIRRKAPIYSIDLDQGIASTVQDQLDLTHAIPLLKETMKLLKNVLTIEESPTLMKYKKRKRSYLLLSEVTTSSQSYLQKSLTHLQCLRIKKTAY